MLQEKQACCVGCRLCNFDAFQDLESSKISQWNLFWEWKHNLQPLERVGAVKIFSQRISDLMNELNN